MYLADVSSASTLPFTAAGGGSLPLAIIAAISLRPDIRADGLALLAHQLEPVVVGRIVAGGDHHAAVELPGEGGEVHAFGAAQADVEHVDAGVGEAADQLLGEHVAGEADVAAHRHPLRLHESRERAADLVDEIFVDLFGNLAPDVVGLERGEIDH